MAGLLFSHRLITADGVRAFLQPALAQVSANIKGGLFKELPTVAADSAVSVNVKIRDGAFAPGRYRRSAAISLLPDLWAIRGKGCGRRIGR